jgi:dTDP-4-dehydrorhamnose 3,5-epimerase
MRITPSSIPGAYLVQPEAHVDERGSFARTFCRREFGEHGLPTDFVQHSISTNRARGTLRGLHYQLPPHQETKLVRCLRGAVWDVIVDMRERRNGRFPWVGVTLEAEAGTAVLVPAGCAHGFQTLTDGAELLYMIDAYHEPGAAAGLRWDDPALAIDWPIADPILSPRDREWPLIS